MKADAGTVLFVSLGVDYGGAETYYVKLAKVLQPGFTIVAVVGCLQLADDLRELGIDVVYADQGFNVIKRYVSALRACWKMVCRHRPHLAHLNGQPESYLALFFRAMGMRVLTSRHTPFTELYLREGSGVPAWIKRMMVITSLRVAACTICDSQLIEGQLKAYLPASRLAVVPPWVEDALRSPYDRPAPSRPLRALFLGRVVKNKGVLDVIEAVRSCDVVSLTVVGEGEQMAEAKQRSKGLPIVFTGFQHDCLSAYRAADLLIFASPEGFEGLPQVPLEALAMGVPCLAGDISSVLEIAAVSADEPPVIALYKHGDVDDMVLQLKALASDPARLAQLTASGRRQIERRFTVAAVTEPLLRIFHDALKLPTAEG